MNFLAEFLQSVRRMVSALQTESLGDFEAFFFVKPKDYIKVFLERCDQFQGAKDIVVRPFLWVGKIDEKLAPASLESRSYLFEDSSPDIAHVSQHGQVDEADQIGGHNVR